MTNSADLDQLASEAYPGSAGQGLREWGWTFLVDLPFHKGIGVPES